MMCRKNFHRLRLANEEGGLNGRSAPRYPSRLVCPIEMRQRPLAFTPTEWLALGQGAFAEWTSPLSVTSSSARARAHVDPTGSRTLDARQAVAPVALDEARKLLGRDGKALLIRGGCLELASPDDLRIDDEEARIGLGALARRPLDETRSSTRTRLGACAPSAAHARRPACTSAVSCRSCSSRRRIWGSQRLRRRSGEPRTNAISSRRLSKSGESGPRASG